MEVVGVAMDRPAVIDVVCNNACRNVGVIVSRINLVTNRNLLDGNILHEIKIEVESLARCLELFQTESRRVCFPRKLKLPLIERVTKCIALLSNIEGMLSDHAASEASCHGKQAAVLVDLKRLVDKLEVQHSAIEITVTMASLYLTSDNSLPSTTEDDSLVEHTRYETKSCSASVVGSAQSDVDGMKTPSQLEVHTVNGSWTCTLPLPEGVPLHDLRKLLSIPPFSALRRRSVGFLENEDGTLEIENAIDDHGEFKVSLGILKDEWPVSNEVLNATDLDEVPENNISWLAKKGLPWRFRNNMTMLRRRRKLPMKSKLRTAMLVFHRYHPGGICEGMWLSVEWFNMPAKLPRSSIGAFHPTDMSQEDWILAPRGSSICIQLNTEVGIVKLVLPDGETETGRQNRNMNTTRFS